MPVPSNHHSLTPADYSGHIDADTEIWASRRLPAPADRILLQPGDSVAFDYGFAVIGIDYNRTFGLFAGLKAAKYAVDQTADLPGARCAGAQCGVSTYMFVSAAMSLTGTTCSGWRSTTPRPP